LKIKNKRNRKTNFIFWNFEDQKEWKTKQIFRTNIIKESKIPLAFKKQKIGKIGQKNPKNLLIIKGKKTKENKAMKGNKN
jgi:hypothetical protein